MNLTKKEYAIDINNLINLPEYLSSFEDFVATKFTLETGEYFYFENNALLGSEVGYETLIELDLKLWHAFSCVRNLDEDCVETKTDSDYAKVIFQIWLEDIFYKYCKPVPPTITNNLKGWDRVLTYGPAKTGFE